VTSRPELRWSDDIDEPTDDIALVAGKKAAVLTFARAAPLLTRQCGAGHETLDLCECGHVSVLPTGKARSAHTPETRTQLRGTFPRERGARLPWSWPRQLWRQAKPEHGPGQNMKTSKWAQLGSNQRPLACRRNITVARHRLPSPEVPASCTDRLGTSPCVAWCLPPSAPRLAPRNLVSFANEWHYLGRPAGELEQLVAQQATYTTQSQPITEHHRGRSTHAAIRVRELAWQAQRAS